VSLVGDRAWQGKLLPELVRADRPGCSRRPGNVWWLGAAVLRQPGTPRSWRL